MATLMTAITTRRQIPPLSTLFLIDEAAQLGDFPPLMQAITLGRGYGIRVHSFWQDLSQLSHAYPTQWRTLVNNCGVKQTFGLTDPFMAAGLDELFNVSVNDLTRLASNEQYLVRSGETVKASKLDYLKDTVFKGMFDTNPYHGGDWPQPTPKTINANETDELSLMAIAQRGRPDDDNNLKKRVPNV
jgi:type IV secretion system protein VirD4